MEAEHEFGKEGTHSFGKHLLSDPVCPVHIRMLKEQKGHYGLTSKEPWF